MVLLYQVTFQLREAGPSEIVRLRRFLKRAKRSYGLKCIRIDEKEISAESRKRSCSLCGGCGAAVVYNPSTDTERIRQCPFCLDKRMIEVRTMESVALQFPREPIEQIAREVFESMSAAQAVADAEAEETKQTIARILAKKFVTLSELQVLLNCSRGYIGKLLEEADAATTEHPLPYCDLNGLIMFEPEAVMEWARSRKPLQKSKRKQGARKERHLREIKQAVSA